MPRTEAGAVGDDIDPNGASTHSLTHCLSIKKKCTHGELKGCVANLGSKLSSSDDKAAVAKQM